MARRIPPALIHEQRIAAQGGGPTAGLDEAGRGAWAGPVTAGAVILPLARGDLPLLLEEVRDSKLCTPLQRERLLPLVQATALAWGAGSASADEIDRYGIIGATRLAMQRALEKLAVRPRALLIDGRYLRLPQVNLPQTSLRRGEWYSLSIAAASIIAKVTRDRLMIEMDDQFPGYGFAAHKGYGTEAHQQALNRLGPSALHRRTFAPVRRRLLEGPG